MTKYEKLVVSVYTDTLMVSIDELHPFINAVMGRPVFTHELADPAILTELKEKVKPDFLRLCEIDTVCPVYLTANPSENPYMCNGSLWENCNGCEFFYPHCDTKENNAELEKEKE